MIKELVLNQLDATKFTKQISDYLLSTPKSLGSSTLSVDEEVTILDTKVSTFLRVAIEQFHSPKGQNLYELLWINGLECLRDHIKLYKATRAEVEIQLNVTSEEQMMARHLDDFNDFSAENENENVKWSQNLDAVHNMMLLRLRANRLLHPAVGQDHEAEQAYLRDVANQCLALFDQSKLPTSQSKIIQILLREWIVCKGVWPLMHHFAQPDTINQYILEKTNRRLVIQKAVKKFCTKLESDHTQFPPVFLISHYVPQKFTTGEKIRYLDVIVKYSKKATSLIDINAVRHEIQKEIKRERDDREDKNMGGSDWDLHKRYLRLLENVMRKLEKRIKILGSDNFIVKQGIMRVNSTKEQMADTKGAELSLDVILEKYFKSSEEKGDMHSTSLFYFLDFLEKKKDGGKSLTLLRFWAATEKYKRLVWRVGSGLLSEPLVRNSNLQVEEFSPATHLRLQKEVHKIYETFLENQSTLTIDVSILEAYRRYIAPLSQPGATFYAADYMCVFKTQHCIHEELEKTFDEFQHSNSFFQWASEIHKSKIIQDTPLLSQASAFLVGDDDWISVFEESALMNSLEDALLDACGRVTGTQLNQSKDHLGSFADLGFANAIITLDDIVVDRGDTSQLERDDDHTSPVKEEEEIHAPGELITNTSKLTEINQNVERIMHQIDCLNLLQRKVNQMKSEMDPIYIMQCHIIEEAKDLLGQEIGDLSKQKAKLESQEQREALMPGQCFVSIQELDDPEEEERPGKKVTYYLITVEQRHLMTGWTVKRRYSDFDALHHKLREEFEIVNDFELPSKTLGLGLLSRSKAEMKASRLKALEKYLQVNVNHVAFD
jgi:hypothetical protein